MFLWLSRVESSDVSNNTCWNWTSLLFAQSTMYPSSELSIACPSESTETKQKKQANMGCLGLRKWKKWFNLQNLFYNFFTNLPLNNDGFRILLERGPVLSNLFITNLSLVTSTGWFLMWWISQSVFSRTTLVIIVCRSWLPVIQSPSEKQENHKVGLQFMWLGHSAVLL